MPCELLYFESVPCISFVSVLLEDRPKEAVFLTRINLKLQFFLGERIVSRFSVPCPGNPAKQKENQFHASNFLHELELLLRVYLLYQLHTELSGASLITLPETSI